MLFVLQVSWYGNGRGCFERRHGTWTFKSEISKGLCHVVLHDLSAVVEGQLIADELDGHKGRMHREEKTAQKHIKEAAKRGDMTSAKLLARELVRTRKAVRIVCRLAVMGRLLPAVE